MKDDIDNLDISTKNKKLLRAMIESKEVKRWDLSNHKELVIEFR